MPSGVHLTGVQRGKISALNELGYSARQIEKKLGISKHAILNYLHDPLAGTWGHDACRKLETSMRVTRQILSSASCSLRSSVDIKLPLRPKRLSEAYYG